MEQKVFYIRDGENIHEIPLSYFDQLAIFSTTLDPLPEIKEEFGYAAALEEYFLNSCQPNSKYEVINSSPEAKEFLCKTIAVTLIEQDIRVNGFCMESFEKYEQIIKEYRSLLRESKTFSRGIENIEEDLGLMKEETNNVDNEIEKLSKRIENLKEWKRNRINYIEYLENSSLYYDYDDETRIKELKTKKEQENCNHDFVCLVYKYGSLFTEICKCPFCGKTDKKSSDIFKNSKKVNLKPLNHFDILECEENIHEWFVNNYDDIIKALETNNWLEENYLEEIKSNIKKWKHENQIRCIAENKNSRQR